MEFIAHRGNIGNQVENNIEGILKALTFSYIDGVEVDVRMTQDKKFVLSHNMLVKDQTGNYQSISSSTLKQLKKKKFISKKRIYNLESFDLLLKKFPKNKILMIECKFELGDYKSYGDALLKVLKKYKYLRIYLCSFHYKLAIYLKERCPFCKVGILVGYTLNLYRELYYFDFVSIHYKMLQEKHINFLKMPYYIWTVNHKKEFLKLKTKNEVDGVISDDVKKLL